MKITFYGAVEEVTGSRYLVESNGAKILVDCGSFQGKDNESRDEKNPFPVDAHSIDAVVLTHAHIDHTGYVPRLVKDGFKGKVYCSQGTLSLCGILLMDSGFLQEERARKYGGTPLYTMQDAKEALDRFQVLPFDTSFKIDDTFSVSLISSGHILGGSFVILSDGKEKITFSGDLGRPNQLLMKVPPHIKNTDYLVLESTYGNRLHAQEDPVEAIGEIVSKTLAKKGIVIIPSFAVGRSQAMLYILYQLKEQGVIPDCPIFLDSPMAIKVTDLTCQFKDEIKLSVPLCNKAMSSAKYTTTQKDSMRINKVRGPAIIIAGSGMSEGGRILHHFQHRLFDKKNTVLFVGYQAEGTLGRALTEGKKEITLFGKNINVNATIKKVDMLSAHADYNEILHWLSFFESAPKKVFLTHGELDAAKSLKKKIEERFSWSVAIPKYLDSFELD